MDFRALKPSGKWTEDESIYIRLLAQMTDLLKSPERWCPCSHHLSAQLRCSTQISLISLFKTLSSAEIIACIHHDA